MARRGDYAPPKLNARQKYLQKVNYNQQVAQLEGLYRGGATVEDVRAIRESWNTNTPYTVADTDTLSTIAQKNGTTETDILKANPDVNRIQTGMVINTPGYGAGGLSGNQVVNGYTSPALPGSESWRVQNAYKPGLPAAAQVGGLPSNAAIGASMGGLSTYREGEKQYTPGVTPAPRPAPTGFGTLSAPSIFQPAVNAGGIASINPRTQAGAPTNSLSPTAQAARPSTPFNPTFRTKDDSYPTQLRAQIDLLNMTPSPTQLNYLMKLGLIKKNPAPASFGGGGSFSYKNSGRGGGGRGGGGGGKAPKTPLGGMDYAKAERQPAFGNGAGFHGLVNWRI